MSELAIKDMSYGYPEHGAVMDHIVAEVSPFFKNTKCKIMREQWYRWEEENWKDRFPDISILCDDKKRKGLGYCGIPRFIVEVLADSTENIDRNEKMDLYCKIGVEEYWLIDWRKREIERYLLDDYGNKYLLHDKINEGNKADLNILSFPDIKIDFDYIFDFSNY